MPSLRYLIRRLISAVFVLIGVSVLVFRASRLIPSDPAALFAGPRPSQEQLEVTRAKLHLDRPLHLQYAYYVRDALSGDFGVSFRSRRAISDDIERFLPATLELVVAAMVIAVLIGIPVGAIAALRPGRPFDQGSRILAITTASLPIFWLAMILQLIFFNQLDLLPLSGRLSREVFLLHPIESITGFHTIDALVTGNWRAFGDALAHIVLPAATLALYPLGLAIRMTRSSLGEVMGERYILAARGLGVGERTILFRLALLNALSPTLTVLGLTFAFSLTGAVLVEVVFAWPGLGRYVTDAILSVDFPVIMAVTLIGTLFYVLVNLAVDLVQAAIDPRIELA